METLAFKTARERVELYQHQSAEILAQHQQALECRDCEDHLQLAIEAFHWIERAQQRIEEAAYEGKLIYAPELERAITDLYEAWLVPGAAAEDDVRRLLGRGYEPNNLGQFRDCCEEARDRLEQRWLMHIARKARMNGADSD